MDGVMKEGKGGFYLAVKPISPFSQLSSNMQGILQPTRHPTTYNTLTLPPLPPQAILFLFQFFFLLYYVLCVAVLKIENCCKEVGGGRAYGQIFRSKARKL